MTAFNFNTAPRIVFGDGAIARIGEIAAAQLGKRVLLVTDPGLIKVGLIEPACHLRQLSGLTSTPQCHYQRTCYGQDQM